MSKRSVRRFVERLLRGKATQRIRPDDFEARQIQTAIDLRAARVGSDAPREEFVAELHQRLAQELADTPSAATQTPALPRRQVVIVGTAAAASAAVGLAVGRTVLAPTEHEGDDRERDLVSPAHGEWRAVGPSADLPAGAAMAFDLDSVSGFIHRTDDGLRAVSAICTHQGCKLSLDAPDRRLRCPCHRTSFSLDGETVTHQLPVAPPPLPAFRTREVNGVIEVFAPVESI
jgi:nitrite reductase/ring-hydroxylating ferredoxin subunit